jgi:molybdopterin converting factor small subunit
MPTVRLPAAMRSFSGGQTELSLEGTTVREVLANLERRCPGISGRLLDERGAVRRYVNIFCNDEDIRFLDALETRVAVADQLTIIPAIAGGA